jgi:hypothetical protein
MALGAASLVFCAARWCAAPWASRWGCSPSPTGNPSLRPCPAAPSLRTFQSSTAGRRRSQASHAQAARAASCRARVSFPACRPPSARPVAKDVPPSLVFLVPNCRRRSLPRLKQWCALPGLPTSTCRAASCFQRGRCRRPALLHSVSSPSRAPSTSTSSNLSSPVSSVAPLPGSTPRRARVSSWIAPPRVPSCPRVHVPALPNYFPTSFADPPPPPPSSAPSSPLCGRSSRLRPEIFSARPGRTTFFSSARPTRLTSGRLKAELATDRNITNRYSDDLHGGTCCNLY